LRGHLEAAGDAILLARVEARLAELRDFLAGRPQALGTVLAHPLAAGVGRATVATARGPLAHELALDADRVAGYVITAPTDLHFAADGPVAAWLTCLHGMAKEPAEARAARAVMAFDPCVPWHCEFRQSAIQG
jgi:hypothetical protein